MKMEKWSPDSVDIHEVADALDVWQKRLGLNDWTIRIEFDDMDGIIEKSSGENEYEFGSVDFCTYRKRAVIRILHPNEYKDRDLFSDWISGYPDPERVLVHELCHLVLVEIGDEYDEQTEQAVCAFENALLFDNKMRVVDINWN